MAPLLSALGTARAVPLADKLAPRFVEPTISIDIGASSPISHGRQIAAKAPSSYAPRKVAATTKLEPQRAVSWAPKKVEAATKLEPQSSQKATSPNCVSARNPVTPLKAGSVARRATYDVTPAPAPVPLETSGFGTPVLHRAMDSDDVAFIETLLLKNKDEMRASRLTFPLNRGQPPPAKNSIPPSAPFLRSPTSDGGISVKKQAKVIAPPSPREAEVRTKPNVGATLRLDPMRESHRVMVTSLDEGFRGYASDTCSTRYASENSSTPSEGSPQVRAPCAQVHSQVLAHLSPQLGPLAIQQLQVAENWIDPTRQSLKPQLIAHLGLAQNAVIERMQKVHGGLNQGLWLLKDSSRELILKMVTSTRFMGFPTEAESFVELARKHGQIANDPSISFPIKLFQCVSGDGQTKDLIVMPRIPGESFADVIAKKLSMGRRTELAADLAAFGEFLARFHARHGMQHGDLQPANVIFDETSRRFSLIDVAEMGNPKIKEKDVDHFLNGLDNLAKHRGRKMNDEIKEAFKVGYARGSSMPSALLG